MVVDKRNPVRPRRMFAIATISFAVIAALCAGTKLWTADKSLPSSFSILPPRAEVARIKVDDPSDVMIQFRFVNRGRRPIEIQSVKTSCGCTVAGDPSKWILKPRDDATLDIRATLPIHGEKLATLTVTVSDGESQAILVPIVLRGVEPKPPFVDEAPERLELRPSSDDDELRREFDIVTVESDSDEPWITGFDSTMPLIRTEIVDCIINRNRGSAISRQYKVVLTADAKTLNNDPVGAWLSVVSRTPAVSQTKRIFVMIAPKTGLQVSPARVFFSHADIARGVVERNVVLTDGDADNSELVVLPAEESWLSASVVGSPQKNIHLLKVRVNPPASVGSQFLQADLTIQVEGTNERQIRLPVTVQLRSQ